MKRLIFHVDVNSAYLSWEAVRRIEAGGEDIRLVASAIGGDRDKRTGVILSRSVLAKKRGVKTGEPVSMALRKCPELLLARPDFSLYEKNSRAFMAICRDFAPVVEQYSIDECFLDMSGTQRMYPDPVAAANLLRERIKSELGFTVNVGVSGNKLLAKMASDFEKPDKVHTLFEYEIASKMWPLPAGELFSVGKNTAERLKAARINTIGELANAEPEHIQLLLGNKIGALLWAYANGRDESPVQNRAEAAKGYSVSTTLEEDVTDMERAGAILLALADSVSARMRADGVKAYCISVAARSNDFKTRSHQRKLYEATDITAEIAGVARELFAELWDGKTPLRLLGIALSELETGDYVQQSLFADAGRERARRLDSTVDSLRGRFGSGIISRGSVSGADVSVGKKYKAQLEQDKKQ